MILVGVHTRNGRPTNGYRCRCPPRNAESLYSLRTVLRMAGVGVRLRTVLRMAGVSVSLRTVLRWAGGGVSLVGRQVEVVRRFRSTETTRKGVQDVDVQCARVPRRRRRVEEQGASRTGQEEGGHRCIGAFIRFTPN